MHNTPKNLSELRATGDFETHCQALVKHLRAHWAGLDDAAPVGYKAFTDVCDDFQGMEEWDTDLRPAEEEAFQGINSASSGGFGFLANVALPHVAYSDLSQGRDPLDSLVGALVSYGMAIGNVYGRQEGMDRAMCHLMTLSNEDNKS